MRIGFVLGISLQTELLILSFFGIMCTIFDSSLLEFNSNMSKIWNLKMDPSRFSERVEYCIKYVNSGNLMIRTFTIHVYLGTYIIMLYPLIFEDRPGLVIPWMAINVLRCLFTGAVSLLSGLYIGLMYRWMKATGWEFLLLNFVCNTPSIYMFSLVLTFYQELVKLMKVHKYIDPVELKSRRRKARLLNEQNLFGYKKSFTRSLDGLMLKRKAPASMPKFLMQPSINPLDSDAIKQGSGSLWQNGNVTTFSMQDAAVSGRGFRVSGDLLEVFAQTSTRYIKRKDAASEPDPKAIDRIEKIEKVSNLDSHKTAYKASVCPVTATKADDVDNATGTQPQELGAEYNTVSELLNDPNIAQVLNMIAGKDELWEADFSKFEKYDITVSDEDPLWSYSPVASNKLKQTKNENNNGESGAIKDRKHVTNTKEPFWTKAEKHDTASQVSTPRFEEAKTILNQEDINNNIHEQSQKDTTKKIVYGNNNFTPARRIEGAPQRRGRSQSPTVSQIYRNHAAYPRTYKDDGYTQAFLANQAKKREQNRGQK